MDDKSLSALLIRATQDDNGPLLDHTWQKSVAAVTITIGVLLIVLASWCCCCRKCGQRPSPTSYHNKDLERAAEQGAQPGQTYQMHDTLAQQQLPIYTGGSEAGLQANGRMPADQIAVHQDIAEPPPAYPGSPIQRRAELAVGH